MKIIKTAKFIENTKQAEDKTETSLKEAQYDAYDDDYDDSDYWNDDGGWGQEDEEDIYNEVLDLIDEFNHQGFKSLKLTESKDGYYTVFMADNIKGDNKREIGDGYIWDIRDIVKNLMINNHKNDYPNDTPIGIEDDNPLEDY